MINNLQDTVTLNNGVKMPGFGLGVYKVEDGETVVQSVKAALEHGYRSIDTASFYDNEAGVGQGIKESAVPREEIFVTSKVWNDQQGYQNTLQAFAESLDKLGLDYLDLYLIHWPVNDKFKETWQALEKLYNEGKVRAIGVSNFHVHHLQDLMADCKVKPVINQVEYHPHLTLDELKAFCEKQQIQLEAWSPLKKGRILDDPTISGIAKKHGKSAAQVILRWGVQQDVVLIPKSVKEHRIIENADIFDFALADDDMKQISDLNKNERTGTNPDSFDK